MEEILTKWIFNTGKYPVGNKSEYRYEMSHIMFFLYFLFLLLKPHILFCGQMVFFVIQTLIAGRAG